MGISGEGGIVVDWWFIADFLCMCRHALDFRLMTEQRVAILDASHSLFPPGNPPAPPPPTTRKGKKAAQAQTHSRKNTADRVQVDDSMGLQPIPGLTEIVLDAIRDATSRGLVGNLAPIDVGVVCDAADVGVLGRAMHDRVRARLKD